MFQTSRIIDIEDDFIKMLSGSFLGQVVCYRIEFPVAKPDNYLIKLDYCFLCVPECSYQAAVRRNEESVSIIIFGISRSAAIFKP